MGGRRLCRLDPRRRVLGPGGGRLGPGQVGWPGYAGNPGCLGNVAQRGWETPTKGKKGGERETRDNSRGEFGNTLGEEVQELWKPVGETGVTQEEPGEKTRPGFLPRWGGGPTGAPVENNRGGAPRENTSREGEHGGHSRTRNEEAVRTPRRV